MEKVKVGYGEGITGETRKYQIIDETLGGKYVLMPFMLLTNSKGKQFLASQPILLRKKEDITGIWEEEIN